MRRLTLACLALVGLLWFVRKVESEKQVAESLALLAEERDLPEETAARILVSGRINGDGYRGSKRISLVFTNPTDWQITEISVEVLVTVRHAPSQTVYALRSMSPVGPGGTDTLSTLLDEPVPYPAAAQWRCLGARGLPPRH